MPRTILLVGIILVASSLRAPITSVGPVVPAIQATLSLSNTMAGLITTIPLLAFAVFSPLAAKSATRWQIEPILWVALWTIAIGLSIRLLPQAHWLLLGTTLIGSGIAFGNVLIPPLIKQRLPDRIGIVTGIYSVSMGITASLASGFSIAIGEWTGKGWQGAIGIWLIAAFAAILVWTPQAVAHRGKPHPTDSGTPSATRSLLGYRRAWYVTIFMGLQSLLFYCAVAWLPLVLQAWGMGAVKSGWMLSLISITQLPVMFIAPVIINKLRDHYALLWITVGTLLSSLIFIMGWKTSLIIPAVILYGLGSGLAFSLVMMWFVLRTDNTADSARLSGMAQSFGYLIAAAGPPLFGALHDWTGQWETSFILLAVASVVLFVVGFPLARQGSVRNS